MHRVMLDHNVWNYLTKRADWTDILTRPKGASWQIVIAPSTVYEALRTSDIALRAPLTRLQTLPRWSRLMPEAFSEAMEFYREAMFHYPDWGAAGGDKRLHQRLLKDWTTSRKGFWARAAENPEREGAAVKAMDNGQLDRAHGHALEMKEKRLTGNLSKELPLPDVKRISPMRPWSLPQEVPAWRVDAAEQMDVIRYGRDIHPYREWLTGFLNFARISDREWDEFWLLRARVEAMPKQWLRWAFQYMQSYRRVTRGTPCDIQLATYLVDCDHFVSADGIFIDMVRRAAQFSPARLAAPFQVSGDSLACDELKSFLDKLSEKAPGTAPSTRPDVRVRDMPPS